MRRRTIIWRSRILAPDANRKPRRSSPFIARWCRRASPREPHRPNRSRSHKVLRNNRKRVHRQTCDQAHSKPCKYIPASREGLALYRSLLLLILLPRFRPPPVALPGSTPRENLPRITCRKQPAPAAPLLTTTATDGW